MLADAVKMVAKRNGTHPNMPTAQMTGSAYSTLFLYHLDNAVPIPTPKMPVTTVIAPKI